MTIHNITFSPTGGTKKVSDIIAGALGEDIIHTELCIPERELKLPSPGKDDICVISVPSFSGRVPEMAGERIKKISGNGAKAVLVCVYGNRACEDTLIELKNISDTAGFVCIAGASALAEHSIARNVAKGRPDEKDEIILKEFALKIKDKILKENQLEAVSLPGNSVYKERSASKPVPKTNDECVKCGICAKNCPAEAISFDNPSATDGDKCIACMKCISVCPLKAKALDKDLYMAISDKLEKACSDRKENELFI